MFAHAQVAARYALGVLLGFVALNAFAGGAYGLAGADSVPQSWLQGTPFRDYFIPSLILLLVVGSASWLATLAAFADWHAHFLGLVASAILLGWIVVQVAIIGYVSPLQPLMAIVAVVIGVLAQFVPAPVVRSAPRRGMPA